MESLCNGILVIALEVLISNATQMQAMRVNKGGDPIGFGFGYPNIKT